VARLACVCHSFRVTASDPTLWRRLDFSPAASNSTGRRVSDAFLRGCLRKAQSLEELSLRGGHSVSWPALLSVAAASAGSLTSLQLERVSGAYPAVGELQALLGAVPQLGLLSSALQAGCGDAAGALRRDPPFARLQLHSLLLVEAGQPGELVGLGEALAAHHALTSLSIAFNVHLWRDPSEAASLLASLRGHPSLRELSVAGKAGEHGAAAGAALAALLGVGALETMVAINVGLGDAGLACIAEALPKATALRRLDIAYNGMSDAFAAEVLLPAVRANGSLRRLVARTGGVDGPATAADLFVRRREELRLRDLR